MAFLDNLLIFMLIMAIIGLPVGLFVFATHDKWQEWRDEWEKDGE